MFGILFCIFILLLILGSIAYFGWSFYQRVIRFKQLCKQANMTKEEIELLSSWIQQFQIKEPTRVLEKRFVFDDLSNQVASAYHTDINLEGFIKESDLLFSIRRRLHFRHDFNSDKIRSSRCLPKGFTLTVLYYDTQKSKYYIFETQILNKKELFLKIAAPTAKIAREILEHPHPELEVWLRKDNSREYRFESRGILAFPPPNSYWLIEHSQKMKFVDLPLDFDMPASILYSPTEAAEVVEGYDIKIKNMTHKQVVIKLASSANLLTIRGLAIINMHIKTSEITCQGIITEINEELGIHYYTILFKEMSDSTTQVLTNFLRDPSKYLEIPAAII
jgi:hypothetical protein